MNCSMSLPSADCIANYLLWPFSHYHERHSIGYDDALTLSQLLFPGSPARTVGWRDAGFIHTSFLKDLWPNSVYVSYHLFLARVLG